MSYSEFDFPHTHFYDTDLRELICKVNKILSTVESLDAWRTQHENEYEELKQICDDIISGNFSPEMVKALNDWFKKYGIDIIGELVKMVFFGITDDGYFVAYIPESWSDIIFGTTGLDDFPEGVDYGHLTLSLMIGGH